MNDIFSRFNFARLIIGETKMHLCETCAKKKGAEMEEHFGLSDLLAGLADLDMEINGSGCPRRVSSPYILGEALKAEIVLSDINDQTLDEFFIKRFYCLIFSMKFL